MKCVAVILFVALVAIDGLPTLDISHSLIGNGNEKTVGGDGYTQEDGLTVSQKVSQQTNTRDYNEDNSNDRSATQNQNGNSYSESGIERRQSEKQERNTSAQNSRNLSVLGKKGVQSSQTSQKSEDATWTREEAERRRFVSHDQNKNGSGEKTRDVESDDKYHRKQQQKTSYNEDDTRRTGLGPRSLTSSLSGSRSSRTSESKQTSRQKQRREQSTSRRGDNTVYQETVSGSNDESETFRESNSNIDYNNQGKRSRGTGNQATLTGGSDQNESGQYSIQRILATPDSSIVLQRGPARHHPINKVAKNVETNKNGGENGNLRSGLRNYRSNDEIAIENQRNYDGYGKNIRNLGPNRRSYLNTARNNNNEQFTGGAGQRRNYYTQRPRIQNQQGAVDYINENYGNAMSKYFSETDSNEYLSDVLNQGVNTPQYIGRAGNPANSGKYLNGIYPQGADITSNYEPRIQYPGADTTDYLSTVLNQRFNSYRSETENLGTNSRQYFDAIPSQADDIKYWPGTQYPGVDNPGLNVAQYISRPGNQVADTRQYFDTIPLQGADKIRYWPGAQYQGVDTNEYLKGVLNQGQNPAQYITATGNQVTDSRQYFNDILRQGADTTKYVSGTQFKGADTTEYLSRVLNQGFNAARHIQASKPDTDAGRYIHGILTQVADKIKYVSGPEYQGTDSKEYLIDALNQALEALNYAGETKKKGTEFGKYVNGMIVQGPNTGEYPMGDRSQDASSKYIKDILTEAQNVLKNRRGNGYSGPLPNGYGSAPIRYIPGDRGTNYDTSNQGIRFYDAPDSSYMSNPSIINNDNYDDNDSTTNYESPLGFVDDRRYRNEQNINGDYEIGQDGYILERDEDGPTTIYGTDQGSNSFLSPDSTRPEDGQNDDNILVNNDYTPKKTDGSRILGDDDAKIKDAFAPVTDKDLLVKTVGQTKPSDKIYEAFKKEKDLKGVTDKDLLVKTVGQTKPSDKIDEAFKKEKDLKGVTDKDLLVKTVGQTKPSDKIDEAFKKEKDLKGVTDKDLLVKTVGQTKPSDKIDEAFNKEKDLKGVTDKDLLVKTVGQTKPSDKIDEAFKKEKDLKGVTDKDLLVKTVGQTKPSDKIDEAFKKEKDLKGVTDKDLLVKTVGQTKPSDKIDEAFKKEKDLKGVTDKDLLVKTVGQTKPSDKIDEAFKKEKDLKGVTDKDLLVKTVGQTKPSDKIDEAFKKEEDLKGVTDKDLLVKTVGQTKPSDKIYEAFKKEKDLKGVTDKDLLVKTVGQTKPSDKIYEAFKKEKDLKGVTDKDLLSNNYEHVSDLTANGNRETSKLTDEVIKNINNAGKNNTTYKNVTKLGSKSYYNYNDTEIDDDKTTKVSDSGIIPETATPVYTTGRDKSKELGKKLQDKIADTSSDTIRKDKDKNIDITKINEMPKQIVDKYNTNYSLSTEKPLTGRVTRKHDINRNQKDQIADKADSTDCEDDDENNQNINVTNIETLSKQRNVNGTDSGYDINTEDNKSITKTLKEIYKPGKQDENDTKFKKSIGDLFPDGFSYTYRKGDDTTNKNGKNFNATETDQVLKEKNGEDNTKDKSSKTLKETYNSKNGKRDEHDTKSEKKLEDKIADRLSDTISNNENKNSTNINITKIDEVSTQKNVIKNTNSMLSTETPLTGSVTRKHGKKDKKVKGPNKNQEDQITDETDSTDCEDNDENNQNINVTDIETLSKQRNRTDSGYDINKEDNKSIPKTLKETYKSGTKQDEDDTKIKKSLGDLIPDAQRGGDDTINENRKNINATETDQVLKQKNGEDNAVDKSSIIKTLPADADVDTNKQGKKDEDVTKSKKALKDKIADEPSDTDCEDDINDSKKDDDNIKKVLKPRNRKTTRPNKQKKLPKKNADTLSDTISNNKNNNSTNINITKIDEVSTQKNNIDNTNYILSTETPLRRRVNRKHGKKDKKVKGPNKNQEDQIADDSTDCEDNDEDNQNVNVTNSDYDSNTEDIKSITKPLKETYRHGKQDEDDTKIKKSLDLIPDAQSEGDDTINENRKNINATETDQVFKQKNGEDNAVDKSSIIKTLPADADVDTNKQGKKDEDVTKSKKALKDKTADEPSDSDCEDDINDSKKDDDNIKKVLKPRNRKTTRPNKQKKLPKKNADTPSDTISNNKNNNSTNINITKIDEVSTQKNNIDNTNYILSTETPLRRRVNRKHGKKGKNVKEPNKNQKDQIADDSTDCEDNDEDNQNVNVTNSDYDSNTEDIKSITKPLKETYRHGKQDEDDTKIKKSLDLIPDAQSEGDDTINENRKNINATETDQVFKQKNGEDNAVDKSSIIKTLPADADVDTNKQGKKDEDVTKSKKALKDKTADEPSDTDCEDDINDSKKDDDNIKKVLKPRNRKTTRPNKQKKLPKKNADTPSDTISNNKNNNSTNINITKIDEVSTQKNNIDNTNYILSTETPLRRRVNRKHGKKGKNVKEPNKNQKDQIADDSTDCEDNDEDNQNVNVTNSDYDSNTEDIKSITKPLKETYRHGKQDEDDTKIKKSLDLIPDAQSEGDDTINENRKNINATETDQVFKQKNGEDNAVDKSSIIKTLPADADVDTNKQGKKDEDVTKSKKALKDKTADEPSDTDCEDDINDSKKDDDNIKKVLKPRNRKTTRPNKQKKLPKKNADTPSDTISNNKNNNSTNINITKIDEVSTQKNNIDNTNYILSTETPLRRRVNRKHGKKGKNVKEPNKNQKDQIADDSTDCEDNDEDNQNVNVTNSDYDSNTEDIKSITKPLIETYRHGKQDENDMKLKTSLGDVFPDGFSYTDREGDDIETDQVLKQNNGNKDNAVDKSLITKKIAPDADLDTNKQGRKDKNVLRSKKTLKGKIADEPTEYDVDVTKFEKEIDSVEDKNMKDDISTKKTLTGKITNKYSRNGKKTETDNDSDADDNNESFTNNQQVVEIEDEVTSDNDNDVSTYTDETDFTEEFSDGTEYDDQTTVTDKDTDNASDIIDNRDTTTESVDFDDLNNNSDVNYITDIITKYASGTADSDKAKRTANKKNKIAEITIKIIQNIYKKLKETSDYGVSNVTGDNKDLGFENSDGQGISSDVSSGFNDNDNDCDGCYDSSDYLSNDKLIDSQYDENTDKIGSSATISTDETNDQNSDTNFNYNEGFSVNEGSETNDFEDTIGQNDSLTNNTSQDIDESAYEETSSLE